MNNSNFTTREPIVIECEDDPMHVAPWYLCGVPDCPCHRDPELIEPLMAAFDRHDLSGSEMLKIYWHMPQEGSNA